MLKHDNGSDRQNRVTALIGATVGVIGLIVLYVVSPIMGFRDQSRDDHIRLLAQEQHSGKQDERIDRLISLAEKDHEGRQKSDQLLEQVADLVRRNIKNQEPVLDWLYRSSDGPRKRE